MSKISSALQFADLANRLRGIRTEAQDSIQAVEQAMQDLANELHELQANVCLEETAAKIANELGSVLDERRQRLYAMQRSAKHLDQHQAVRTVSFSGDKTVNVAVSEGYPYQRLHIKEALDILALLWGPAEIKKFANEAAAANGAKPKAEGGITVAQAVKRSEELIAEIERLDKERIEAISVWAAMQVPAISTHKLAGLPQPEPAAQPAPDKQPTVLEAGPDGVLRPYTPNLMNSLY